MKNNHVEVIAAAEKYLKDGYHCSEAILKAVTEAKLGAVSDEIIKASTAFAGGAALSKQEICGGLSGGLMVIGLLHGRSIPDQNDDFCQELAAEYRSEFIKRFGHAHCKDLQADKYGNAPGHTPCAVLIGEAAGLLMEILEKEQ